MLALPESLVGGKSNKIGISFGVSQLVMFVIFGLLFYIGAVFHKEYDVKATDMFTAIFALMYAAFGAGMNN